MGGGLKKSWRLAPRGWQKTQPRKVEKIANGPEKPVEKAAEVQTEERREGASKGKGSPELGTNTLGPEGEKVNRLGGRKILHGKVLRQKSSSFRGLSCVWVLSCLVLGRGYLFFEIPPNEAKKENG